MWVRKSSYAGAGPSKISTAPTCMWLFARSWARKEASTAERRSPWVCAIRAKRTCLHDDPEQAGQRGDNKDDRQRALVSAAGGEPGEHAAAGDVPQRHGRDEAGHERRVRERGRPCHEERDRAERA